MRAENIWGWELGAGAGSWEPGAGSWEPRAGSWELGLGVGKWAELGRVGFPNKMKMVGELNIVIWEIDHL